MDLNSFAGMMEEIYAAFGRATPSERVVSLTYARVSHIPMEACKSIVDRICEMDKLPANVGLEVLRGWDAWCAQHPERVSPKTHCPDCDSTGVWHIWMPIETGRVHAYVVPCPTCQPDSIASLSAHAIRQLGGDIMPRRYPGGPVGYDRDKQYRCLWPEWAALGDRQPMRAGVDMTPDKSRTAHVPPDEQEDSPKY